MKLWTPKISQFVMTKQATWYNYHQLNQMKQMQLKHLPGYQPQTVRLMLSNLAMDKPLPTAITTTNTIHLQTAHFTRPPIKHYPASVQHNGRGIKKFHQTSLEQHNKDDTTSQHHTRTYRQTHKNEISHALAKTQDTSVSSAMRGNTSI